MQEEEEMEGPHPDHLSQLRETGYGAWHVA